jgi:AraC-like ligand binding domain
MSQKRQLGIFDRLGGLKSAITTLTHDYPTSHVVPLHFHDRDQLVYASRGVMTVRTPNGTWVVPPHRAVWIPAQIPHTITMSGLVAMRTLYLKPGLAEALPRDCCVINVSNLLKELILHACTVRSLKKSVKWQMHLLAVILHQLEVADDPVATSAFVGSKAGSNRRNIDERSSQSSNARSAVQKDWGGKAVCRTTVPTGDRNDVWEMAAATSAYAGDASLGRGG